MVKWIALLFGLTVNVHAEPWISSRFAQNCAACHAPNRVNRPASERRCTLSCQGCHTSPSGGGLRNEYGKWNQERWLWSYKIPGSYLNKNRPDPKQDTAPVKGELGDRGAAALRTTDALLPESAYSRHVSVENRIEPDQNAFEERIPRGDPYWQKQNVPYTAGANLRGFYIEKNFSSGGNVATTFPMAADIGVSVRPARHVNLVWESRNFNNNFNQTWEGPYSGYSHMRSAYVLIDDLPFNSYVQYGLQRPLFGHYSPDHSSFVQKATGLSQYDVYKALSFGTAPNVPFANVHIIEPQTRDAKDQSKGMALNLGARFVTLGAYFMYSWWNTGRDESNERVTRDLHSFTGGFTWLRWTAIGDVTIANKTIGETREDRGRILTWENRLRVFREFYAVGIFEHVNTTLALTPGRASSYSLGVSAFPIASLQTEVLVKRQSERPDGGARLNTDVLLGQLHFFF